MKTKRLSRAGVLGLAVIGTLAAVWVLPPAMNRARHLCPVRPDGVSEAGAMPNWARRYGVDCTVCHTTVPQLNQTGYKFRRAGFRMPDEIGADAKFNNIGDMYSTRVRENYHVQNGWGTSPQAPKNEFLFNELTFYPISGAIGKYWATETELTFMPDELPEVENGYARFTYPLNPDTFITARAGIMHPFEGFGGSDRPISNFRPLFQNLSAKNGSFDSRLRLFGDDMQGLELGATWKDTTISLGIFNGYNASISAADSAKRNTPGSPVVNDDDNDRDYLLFVNQMIGDKASVNFEYYNGRNNWLFPNGNPTSATTTGPNGVSAETGVASGPTWRNNFQRGSLYASYDALPNSRAHLIGGVELGQDHFYNGSDNKDTFNSTGWYLENDSKILEHLTGCVRYDTYRPSVRTAGNRQTAFTLTAAMPFENIKFLVDFQTKRTQHVGSPDTIANVLEGEWMAHF